MIVGTLSDLIEIERPLSPKSGRSDLSRKRRMNDR